jgi:hypothetical protein
MHKAPMEDLDPEPCQDTSYDDSRRERSRSGTTKPKITSSERAIIRRRKHAARKRSK